MLGITDLKTNAKIVIDGDPYVVTDYQHSKMGRGGAVVRTKLRNLRSGATVAKTFQGSDKIEPANLQTRSGQYLFASGDSLTFMDTTSYEQFTLPARVLGDQAAYLTDGLAVTLLEFSGQIIAVELPIKVEYTVTQTDPGLKGDTVAGGSKPATVGSGLTVNVPLFVQTGDTIRVDTRSGTYIERV